MKSKFVLYGLCILLLMSCQSSDEEKSTSFSGHLMNATQKTISIYQYDQALITTELNDENLFHFDLDTLQEGLYNFGVGRDYYYLYLKKGDSVICSANTLDTRGTLNFSGRGSGVNNFLLERFLSSSDLKDFINRSYGLSPQEFSKKIDSLYEDREILYNDFLYKNKDLSEHQKELVQMSAFYDLFAAKESYPLYHNTDSIYTEESLPKDFFKFRKNLSEKSEFPYFQPYFNYNQSMINNKAYNQCYTHQHHKNGHFHLHKAKIIDDLFPQRGILRDNLFRNAIYAFFFSDPNPSYISEYIATVSPYIEDNRYKEELYSIMNVAEKLKTQQKIPLVELQEGNFEKLLSKHNTNLIYFTSENDEILSDQIRKRVKELETLYPKINYIGVRLNQKNTKLENNSSTFLNEYSAVNIKEVYRDFLIYNFNKVVIVDKHGNIINAFGNIFSTNIEKILTDN